MFNVVGKRKYDKSELCCAFNSILNVEATPRSNLLAFVDTVPLKLK
jgi:hypothetical protein